MAEVSAQTKRYGSRRRGGGPVSRRRRRTKQQRQNERVALGVAAVAGLGLVLALVQWLLAHWWVLLVLAAAVLATGAFGWRRHRARRRWEEARVRGLRYQLPRIDGLHHTQFEHAVRDLLHRDGCADAQRVGGRGDLGADVIATDPWGRRWVVQCKHRRDGSAGAPVGTPDLQRLNGTARPVHGAEVVVAVTNGRFTRDAREFGKDQRIHLVGRDLLGRWADGSWPIWDLLPQLPAPRRPTAAP
ncbi:restriction endonuclease [Streptomyces sp. ODS28]|uniref:restriction endonuclease n=1 Tax=Streptomyces sp. ODS28 TaxID=3136688 RepID=UPI0031F0B67E